MDLSDLMDPSINQRVTTIVIQRETTTMLKFDFYKIEESGATSAGSISWDPDSDSPTVIAQRQNKVLARTKDKAFVIAPNGPEAAWILGQKKSRGSKVIVAPAVVRRLFELYVDEDMAIGVVNMPIYAEFEGLVIKEPTIRKILKGERDLDVEVDARLREAAKAKLGDGSKGGRRKYTDDDKAEWERLHLEEGLSGSAIGKAKGINSSIINNHLREAGVQRNRRIPLNKVKVS